MGFSLHRYNLQILPFSQLEHLLNLRIDGEDLAFLRLGALSCIEAVFDLNGLHYGVLPLNVPEARPYRCIFHTAQGMTQTSEGVQSVRMPSE